MEENVWMIKLPSMTHDCSCDIFVREKGKIFVPEKHLKIFFLLEIEVKLSNVIFGDVWFCSGQSNMEMQMYKIANATEEVDMSAAFNIRFTTIANVASLVANDYQDVLVEIPWSEARNSNALR